MPCRQFVHEVTAQISPIKRRSVLVPILSTSVIGNKAQSKVSSSSRQKLGECFANAIGPVKRRNKWICALKIALHDVEIYGPKGNPDADPGPTKYTEMPWEEFKKEAAAAEKKKAESSPAPAGHGVEASYDLADKNAAISESSA